MEGVVERLDGLPGLFLMATEIDVVSSTAGSDLMVSTTSRSFAPPVTLLLLLLVAVLLWLLARALRRHRSGGPGTPSSPVEHGRQMETASR